MSFSAPVPDTWRFSAMPDATVFTAVLLLLLAHAGTESTNPGTALVPARRRRQGWRAGWFARGTVGVKQIQHSADHPISHRNPESECRNDGKQEQGREQKRRHIVLFFRCAGTRRMVPRISLSGSNPGRRAIIYSDNATLPRIDVSRCWRLRYVSRIAFPLSRTFQSRASG
jgi:hypothetical protein